MSIQFTCEKCGHSIDVDDRLAGKHGRCKHCGHTNTVPDPAHHDAAPIAGLKLRPVDPAVLEEHLGEDPKPKPNLELRPAASDTQPLPAELNAEGLDAEEPSGRRRKGPPKSVYTVLDPDCRDRLQARMVRLNPHYETRFARFVASTLRGIRDWLYVISFGFLIAALIGFLFERTTLLHLGVAGVVVTNIGMLVVSVFYLVTVPFRDSLAKGMGNLFFFPYAVYYWVIHWDKMRKPVLDTLRSFTPILVAGLAYFLYEEAPVIEQGVGKVESVIEKEVEALDGKVESLRGTVPAQAKDGEKGGEKAASETAPNDGSEPEPGRRERPTTSKAAPPPF